MCFHYMRDSYFVLVDDAVAPVCCIFTICVRYSTLVFSTLSTPCKDHHNHCTEWQLWLGEARVFPQVCPGRHTSDVNETSPTPPLLTMPSSPNIKGPWVWWNHVMPYEKLNTNAKLSYLIKHEGQATPLNFHTWCWRRLKMNLGI